MKRELIQDVNHEVNAETILEFVSQLSGVTQGFPFDHKTLVFKVGNKAKEKIFALFNIEDFKNVIPDDTFSDIAQTVTQVSKSFNFSTYFIIFFLTGSIKQAFLSLLPIKYE
mgnify:CR=1 FL=1